MKKSSSKRKYAGLSDAERVAQRRERFLAAGLEVFGLEGIRGGTVRKLCKAAGLTERYFYESFDDTEALFCAVYKEQIEALRDMYSEVMLNLPSELNARARACLDLYFSAMRDERLVRILYVEAPTGSRAVVDMHNETLRELAVHATNMIKRDNCDLTIDEDYTQNIALGLHGASASLAVQWMLSGYQAPRSALVDSTLAIVVGAMRELRQSLPART